MRLIPRTMRMPKGARLAAFVGEKESQALFESLAHEHDIQIRIVPMKASEMPGFERAGRLRDACSLPAAHQAFWTELGERLEDDYPHDDETIHCEVMRRFPVFYHCVGEPFAKRQGKLT